MSRVDTGRKKNAGRKLKQPSRATAVALVALSVALALAAAPLAGSDSGPATIGYIGCSNTTMTVQGYQLDGGTRFWTPARKQYSGGTIVQWESNRNYWKQFDNTLASYPDTNAVWLEICDHPNESTHRVIAAAVDVILDLGDRLPGATVYVSAINGFSDHTCRLAGADGPARAQQAADWLVQHGLAQAGPDVGSLTLAQTTGDGCHPNTDGQTLLGQALLRFFG